MYRRLIVPVAIVFALAGLAFAQGFGRGFNAGSSLVGTWRISVTIPAGSSACAAGGSACVFPALSTISSDGTVVQTAPLPGTSVGHGIWLRTGNRHYRIKTTYFRTDATGLPLGTAETVTEIDVANNDQTASGTYSNVLLSLAGQVQGSFNATVQGTRMVP